MLSQLHQGASVSRKKKSFKNYCLGVVLRRLLEERGLSLTKLSQDTKKPLSTLHDWLYGNVPANPEDLKDVADYFGLTRDDLEFGTSKDVEKQNEINKLKKELEEKERALALAQLSIDAFIDAENRKKTG